jgi:urea transport system ATP-binding protein
VSELLSISGLDQYYGGSHILRGVELDVPEGGVIALIGRNGVGKTTLLKVITGLLAARRGQLRFAGRDLAPLPPEQRARLGIGYVPQGRMIFPLLSVEENLRLALAGRSDGAREVPGLVYTQFPVLAEMRRRRGGDLSGGQQQQLAIARALVQSPRLLLLDEPCEGIQPSVVQEIALSIARLRAELGIAVLVVEQRLGFVRSVADSFYIMERGSVRARGPIAELDDGTVERYLSV